MGINLVTLGKRIEQETRGEGVVSFSKEWVLYILAALLIVAYVVIVSEKAFRSGLQWAW
jgi:hypothetical protein